MKILAMNDIICSMPSVYIILFIIIIPGLLYSITQMVLITFKITINKNVISWSSLLLSIAMIGIIARTYRISFAWTPINPETSSPGDLVFIFLVYCFVKCVFITARFIFKTNKKSRSSTIESLQIKSTYEDPVPESFLTKFLEPGIIIMGIFSILQLFLRKEHVLIFFLP